MKVIATAVGYHGKIRQPGEQFDVANGEKGSWFVAADKADRVSPAEAKAAKAKVDAEAKAKADADAKAKAGGQGGNDLV